MSGNVTTSNDVEVDRKPPSYVHDNDHRALPHDLEQPDQSMAGSEEDGQTLGASAGVSTLIAVGATIGVTFVIAVIILTVIVRLVRGQRLTPPSCAASADLQVEATCKKAIKQVPYIVNCCVTDIFAPKSFFRKKLKLLLICDPV